MASGPPSSGGGVDGLGDVEQVEDLSLEVGEFGVEGLHELAVGVAEVVACEAGEDQAGG